MTCLWDDVLSGWLDVFAPAWCPLADYYQNPVGRRGRMSGTGNGIGVWVCAFGSLGLGGSGFAFGYS